MPRIRDSFRPIRENSMLFVSAAVVMFILAALLLIVSAFGILGEASFVGAILFMIFVFVAVTLLLITALSQDITIFKNKSGRPSS